MNSYESTSGPSRLHHALDDVFGPVRAPRGSLERRLLLARSGVAYLGVVTTLVQVVVWLMIGVISGRLDSPWWLWSAVPAAAIVGLLTLAVRWQGWYADAARREEGLR